MHDALAELLCDPAVSRHERLALFDRQVEIEQRRRARFDEIETEVRDLLAHVLPMLPKASRVLIPCALFSRISCLLAEQSEYRYATSPIGFSCRAFDGRQVPFWFDPSLSGTEFMIER